MKSTRPALLVTVALIISILAAAGVSGADGSRATGPVDISAEAGQSLTAVVDPGRSVSFDLVVTNTGATTDDFNLTWTGLPSGWSLAMDGPQGPLTDGSYLISGLTPNLPFGMEVIVTSPEGKNKPKTADINITTASQTGGGEDFIELQVTRPYTAKFTAEVILDIENPTATEIELLPGGDTVVFVDIENKGNVDDLYGLALQVSSDLRGGGESRADPAEWTALFTDGTSTAEVGLAAKDSGVDTARLSFILTAPQSIPDGGEEVDVILTATSKSAGATAVERTFRAIVLDVPSYVLLESDGDERVITPGEGDSFHITATNIGHQTVTYVPPETAEITAQFTSGDAAWTAALSYGLGTDPGSGTAELEVGESAVYALAVTAPVDAAADDLNCLTFAGSAGDGGGVIDLELTVRVGLVHNITFTPVAPSLELRPGDAGEVEFTIVNNGNGNDTVTVLVSEAPSEFLPTLSDSLVTLTSGDSQTLSLTFTVPLDAALKSYTFCLGMTHLIDDVTESCGELTLTLTVDDQPDPALPADSAIVVPQRILDPGEVVLINATVVNLGRLDASDITVTFAYQTRKLSVIDIGEVTIENLPGGEEYTASVSWTPDPSATRVIVTVDAGDDIAELDEKNNQANESVAVLAVSPGVQATGESSDAGSSFWTSGDRGAIGVVIFLVAVILAFLFNAMASEVGRYGLFSAFAPLYSKLRPDRILDNDIRSQVFDYVKANPGDHFRSIMSNLNLTNGTLAYHLATLERSEMIKSERDGGYKRFYPRGRQFVGEVIEVNGLQKQIIDVIADNPGISQKKISLVIGTSTPTVSYHVKALKAARLIEVRREGKMTRCYISTPAA